MVFKPFKKTEEVQPIQLIPTPPAIKETPKEVYEVVVRIPTQEIRREMRDGVIVNYVTVEEFQLMKMTEELNAKA
jgi:hypothetical protein